MLNLNRYLKESRLSLGQLIVLRCTMWAKNLPTTTKNDKST